MLNVNVITGNKEAVLQLPTAISEITTDYLNAVTADVHIEPNWALIALCVSDKLSVLCASKKPSVDVKGVGIFIRANDPNKIVDVRAGEKIIAAPTDIMMGMEVTAPANILSPSKVTNMCASTKELISKIYSYVQPVWLVTFKLVPLNTIHGSYRNLSDEEYKDQKAIASQYLVK